MVFIEYIPSNKKAKVYQRPSIDSHSSEKEQHGRKKIRRCWVYNTAAKLPIATEWIDLVTVVRVETERTLQEKNTRATVLYFQSSVVSKSCQ